MNPFLQPIKDFDEIEIEGIPSMRYPFDMDGHKEGDIIPWRIKDISTKKVEEIRKLYTTTKVVRGVKQEKVDEEKLGWAITAEYITYPNLEDKELLEYHGCVSKIDLLKKILNKSSESSTMINRIRNAIEGTEENIEGLKNE